MKSRILLLGKNGQVGSELENCLPRLDEVIALNHCQLDLADHEGIRRAFSEYRPHLIVNAAAYTDVDRAETDAVAAHAVNAEAPRVIAEEARKIRAAVVHYSTDYIFDGEKKCPYEETDEPNPINAYGKTKLEGERAIQSAGVPHLILRTSWVYASQGRNFLLRFLRRASEREELHVVQDQLGAPTWSRMIALGTAHILARICSSDSGFSRLGEFGGVYHLTAAGETSWYDFARAILEECGHSSPLGSWFHAATRGKPLILRRIVPTSCQNYSAPTRRPAYSVLSNTKLLRTFGLQLPNWRAQLHLAFCGAQVDNFDQVCDQLSH